VRGRATHVPLGVRRRKDVQEVEERVVVGLALTALGLDVARVVRVVDDGRLDAALGAVQVDERRRRVDELVERGDLVLGLAVLAGEDVDAARGKEEGELESGSTR